MKLKIELTNGSAKQVCKNILVYSHILALHNCMQYKDLYTTKLDGELFLMTYVKQSGYRI